MKLWQLEEQLQQVKPFSEAKTQLEQYATTAHLASHMIYTAAGNRDIEEKYVLDLGTGTAMLAIGCALMGAANVIGIDIDPDALKIARENISTCDVEDQIELLQIDAQSFEEMVKIRLNETQKEPANETIDAPEELKEKPKRKRPKNLFDTVVINPPFGTRIKGADMQFLKIATELTNSTVYSLHKTSTREFVTSKATQWGFSVEVVAQMQFDLEKTMSFHKKNSKPIEVDLLRLKRVANAKRVKSQEKVRTTQTNQARRVVAKAERKKA